MVSDVDSIPDFHNKRYQLILQIQDFSKEGCSNREIVKCLGIDRNTVSKNKTGDLNSSPSMEFSKVSWIFFMMI
ncbi:MAG: hypothetical protein K0R92_2301 [Lachnospiraceae bacterium]|jgi:hypothetical protein|nr:hypothetical protein [Lachnospiraceae bacterium]